MLKSSSLSGLEYLIVLRGLEPSPVYAKLSVF